MYGVVFALLLLVIAGIYFHYNTPSMKEGFTGYDGSRPLRERQDPTTMGTPNVDPLVGLAKEDCYYKFNAKEPFVSSMGSGAPEDVKAGTLLLPYTPNQLGPSPVAKVEESEESPKLPTGPYRSISQDAPVAFIDPANTRTKFIRVRRAYDDLVGFFNNESQMLEGSSDPTIQQPLLLAKSDLKRLEEEVNLLDRNPGLDPSLTEKDMNEISANLRYLQRQSRLLANTGEMAYAHTDTEGFAGSSTQVNAPLGLVEGFEDINTLVSANSAMLEENFTNNPQNSRGPRATVKDLVEFKTRLWAETKRLNASNTSSPIVKGRTEQMDKIYQDIERILTDVKRGTMKETDIPIFQSDIKNAYPVLSDPTKPFPKLLKETGLPPELQNLLPPGVKPSSSETEKLIMKYVAQILNNTAVDVSVGLHYKPPHYVVDKAAGCTRIPQTMAAAKGPLGAASDIKIAFADANYHNPQDPSAMPSGPMSVGAGAGARDPANPRPPNTAGGRPGHFDWETKTKQICEAIRNRGLKPADYACLPPGAKVSKDYLWRGHAKMVCSRLDTAPEANVAPLVGCPPQSWPGWHIGGDL